MLNEEDEEYIHQHFGQEEMEVEVKVVDLEFFLLDLVATKEEVTNFWREVEQKVVVAEEHLSYWL